MAEPEGPVAVSGEVPEEKLIKREERGYGYGYDDYGGNDRRFDDDDVYYYCEPTTTTTTTTTSISPAHVTLLDPPSGHGHVASHLI